MASIEVRAGKTRTTHRVVWRQGGRKITETFLDAPQAELFRSAVESCGDRLPHGWIRGQGFAVQEQSALPTFAEFAELTVAVRSRANERTRADYLRDLRLHINPTFGELPLDQITRQHVGQWLISLSTQSNGRGRTASAKTINNLHGLASSIMSDAVDDGLIGRNVFKGAAAAVPTVKSEEMVFLTRPQFDVLNTQVIEHYRTLTLFLVLTGLRWSEATALTVSDVRMLGRSTVTVSKAWKRAPDNTYFLGEPKSRRSRRTISMPEELTEALVPLVAARQSHDRLFVTQQGYTIHHSNFQNRFWTPAVRRAQNEDGPIRFALAPRIHDLRHSHAAMLISAGVNLVAVQRRMGHESIQTTIGTYGHLAPEIDLEVLAALDKMRPASTESSLLTEGQPR